MKPRISLPIDTRISEIVSTLEGGKNLVLQASPGSGKTTRVPAALLETGFCKAGQEILVLEPRRLAAKFAARRVAEERGEKVGQTVGYHFRFERVTGPGTRLLFLTEGMLMRRLMGDPELRGVAAVVLDEFHERHLHGDVALSYLKKIQAAGRPDLRILVMSATLDAEKVSAFLDRCPVLSIESPMHPVETDYLPQPPGRFLESTVTSAVRQVLVKPQYPGDILVFLPGMADIRRAERALLDLEREDLLIVPLHGELSREEQDRAILKGDRRKVILSTNVAETSLTIEGLSAVIDSGLHRIASYSWWSGVPALRTRPVSRASAVQRAGRAGRTGPGYCLRLYTAGDFSARPPFETPEIQRADLCQTLLELKSLGVRDPVEFPWFEAPSPKALEAAMVLLHRLGALTEPGPRGAITELGRRLGAIPAHPRIGRLLCDAEERGVVESAATLAALISEGELERLDALEQLPTAGRDMRLARVRTQLLSSFQSSRAKRHPGKDETQALSRAVLAGFPDRVARKRVKGGEAELLFSAGGSAKVDLLGPILDGEYFVALDVQDRQGHGQIRSQSKVHSVCRIEPEWLLDLEPTLVRETEESLWDAERGKTFKVTRLLYDQLVLSEDRVALETPAGAGLLFQALDRAPGSLAEMTLPDWVATLGKLIEPERVENFLSRVALASKHFPQWLREEEVAARFAQAVEAVASSKGSLAELRAADWEAELPFALFPEHAARFEALLPRTILLGRGRKCPIQYRLGQPPWIESRLQDFFGLKSGPAVLEGRVPLTLHLLAPNYRAIQVTTDLPGFWKRAYQELRPSLSRRYPRHSWPENPEDL